MTATIHTHPASVQAALENARTIIRAEVGTYPDEEVLFAARELQAWGDFLDVVQGQMVERNILGRIETRQMEDARRALDNVYPPLWPGLIVIGCAFGVALGFALLVMP